MPINCDYWNTKTAKCEIHGYTECKGHECRNWYHTFKSTRVITEKMY